MYRIRLVSGKDGSDAITLHLHERIFHEWKEVQELVLSDLRIGNICNVSRIS